MIKKISCAESFLNCFCLKSSRVSYSCISPTPIKHLAERKPFIVPALGIEHSAEEERYRDLPKEEEENARGVNVNRPPATTITGDSSAGWEVVESEEHGTYYYNQLSGETSWELPTKQNDTSTAMAAESDVEGEGKAQGAESCSRTTILAAVPLAMHSLITSGMGTPSNAEQHGVIASVARRAYKQGDSNAPIMPPLILARAKKEI
jgi:hypothetical protein